MSFSSVSSLKECVPNLHHCLSDEKRLKWRLPKWLWWLSSITKETKDSPSTLPVWDWQSKRENFLTLNVN
jgi:hypothetical protein